MAANPIMTFIGLIDFIVAFLLIWHFPGDFTTVISLIILSKGIWSILSSIHAGFYLDAFGALDFIAGITLLIINFGNPIGFAWLIGVILAIKAIYTFLSSI